MKGLAHFATGVAVATFFPQVVHDAALSAGFGPLLGGLAGLLPDTLDFKFTRYFDRVDIAVDPALVTTEDGHPDPQAMAEQIAAAMNRAYRTGCQVKIQLHTVKLGADRWRQYTVTLDPTHSQVLVRIGPVVTTGRVPYPDSDIPGLPFGRAQVGIRIQHTYDAEIKIDVFSGPSLSFRKAGEAVEVTFLPWHRSWSHSLAMAILLGAVGCLIAPVYGLVMTLAALAHIAADQLGYMGSNLFFPLTGRRTRGLGLWRSGDALPSFLMGWVSVAVIVLNLDRFSTTPSLATLPYVLGVIVGPCLLFLGLNAWASPRSGRPLVGPSPERSSGQNREQPIRPSALAAAEALDETREVDN